MVKYWTEIADFNLPHLCLVPLVGVTLLKYCRGLWRQKTSTWRCLREPPTFCPLLQCRLVMDGQTNRWTNGWTHYDRIYCASILQ